MIAKASVRRTLLVMSIGSIGLVACKDKTAPPQPAAVTAVSTVAPVGTVGEFLANPLTVKVTDANGTAVPNIVVTFTVAEGGGIVAQPIDTTDNTGVASTTWRLGERTVAQRVTAQATGVGSVVNFVATANPGAPATMAVQAGDNQTAAAGASVATAPSVVIKDKYTNAVPGVSVFFSISNGGGSVTGAGAVTNSSGVASVGGWTLGSAVGSNKLSALAVFNGITGNPITFSATAISGTAATITPQGPPGVILGSVGALVTPIPSVRVLDANGNAVAGATVTFASSAGSNVVGATKSTDANGLAAPDGWQLGTVAQNYTLTATVGSLSAVTFTATARPGAPSQVAISAGNNQTVVSGRTVPTEPAVRVADSFNNPIAGVDVVFAVTSGGGSASSRFPTTNALGIATVGGWTLGDAVGANTLSATVQSSANIAGNPVVFSAIGTAGAPTSVSASSGINQTATVGSAVTIAPAVVVRDNRGNPVSGVTVTFIVSSGGGTLTGATSVTNAAGLAAVGSWTLGGAAGTQSVIARVNGLPDVTFTATATPGAAALITALTISNFGNIVVSLGQGIPTLPSVKVTDASGNAIVGATVTFTLGNAFSGTITGDTQATNANGIATLGSWTLPTSAGTVSVVATVNNLTGVTFIANMVAGAPTQMVLQSVIPASKQQLTTISVTARLLDQFGNAATVSGVAVTFTPGANSGTVSASPVSTDATGVATTTWTLGAVTTPTQTMSVTSGTYTPIAISVAVTP
jgi:adhesin/invasin